MCRSKADGGRRCTGTLTGRALQQLYRERRAYPARASEITVRINALKEASRLYGGRFVTPYTIGVPTGIPEALDAARAAGNPLVVGGAVRDSVLGTASKDIDIEVYGTDLNTLTSAFRARGFMVDEVGQAFGVLKVSKPGVVSDLDVAVPRRENATGAGHRDFEVAADAGMTVTEVTNRRDFTMNAILYDPAREVAVDPTGGFNDIEHGILRHVGPQFAEDPLRVLRAFQFAGRFAMTLDPMTAKLCRKLRKQYTTLPKERVREEWTKFFAKSTRPDWVCRRSRLPDGMTRCQV